MPRPLQATVLTLRDLPIRPAPNDLRAGINERIEAEAGGDGANPQ